MFTNFAQRMHVKFDTMSKQELFVLDIDKDKLYETYLAAFPEGTNPIYKTHTEHDCTCCKQFIRNVGSLVTITNGVMDTVWNTGSVEPYPYNVVAEIMHGFVIRHAVKGVWRTSERRFGTSSNQKQMEDGTVHTFHHYWAQVSARHYSQTPDKDAGTINTDVGVFLRGLETLDRQAIIDVLDLIDKKSLYRGEETRHALNGFLHHLTASQGKNKALYAWEHCGAKGITFRNTAIGTLIVDLSEGKDMEEAVPAYEAKMDPRNYKRPTPLVSTAMINKAVAELTAAGLDLSLERRHAKISDVSINNVLWADNTARKGMGLTDLLLKGQPADVQIGKTQQISIEDFIANVVPTATTMDLMVRNSQQGNFVSLTTACYEDSKKLFQWPNHFAWSYDGDVTDSIKERVKAAGGNVNAKLRVSLGWYNFDDLDLHGIDPFGNHICFHNKMGILDVDMNAMFGKSRNAVENLAWTNPRNGDYKIMVHQYQQREKVDVGFTLELACGDYTESRTYTPILAQGITVHSLIFHYQDGKITNARWAKGMTDNAKSVEKWGVHTESFTKVETLMYSPNHWDGAGVGNRHYIFVLKDCKNPNEVRAIYNEYLNNDLSEHRKVLELIGARKKVPVKDEQLSGVGFSSTRKDTVAVRVLSNGKSTVYNISF